MIADAYPTFSPVVPRDGGREGAMRACVEALWGALGNSKLSWVGFYIRSTGEETMELVCREPKPACSPIGLHGMCGRCWKERLPIVVRDVATLGPNYIACDPRDRSELVVPCISPDGSCWGVLDADSYATGAFDARDAAEFSRLMVRLGLTVQRVVTSPILWL